MHENSQNIIEINDFFSAKGIDFLTVEGRILVHLMFFKRSRVKDLMTASGSSYRGFYLAFERLKAKNLVRSEIDQADRRVRIVRLA